MKNPKPSACNHGRLSLDIFEHVDKVEKPRPALGSHLKPQAQTLGFRASGLMVQVLGLRIWDVGFVGLGL